MTGTLLASGVALAAAVVFYALGRAAGRADTDTAATTRASEQAMQLHDRTLGWRQKVRAIQDEHERKLTAARIAAAAARKRAEATDSALASGVADTLRSQETDNWHRAADAERTRSEECQLTLNACVLRADRAEEDAQRLRERLGGQVAVQECRVRMAVWRVPCPSRSTMFFGGVALGVVTTVVVAMVGR